LGLPLASVGSYLAGASPYGVLDMAGNVWEWVNDWFDSGYYSSSSYSNPLCPDSGVYKVLRGGSFLDNWDTSRVAFRRYNHTPGYRDFYNGFRCAAPPGF
jgi:formylglycine-generating enzyme required for sulfatase activity